jgi:predicted nucleotidyltransferase
MAAPRMAWALRLDYIGCMRRAEIIARLKAAEPEIRARGAAALYLFGSVARDEAGPESDVDVFVDPDPARSFGFNEFMDIYELLQMRLGMPVGYTTREGLHARLRSDIEKSAIRVF